MAEQDILQSVYPYIGGQENVSRTIPRKGTLYLMLKDAGVVNLAAVNQVQGVIRTSEVRRMSAGRFRVRARCILCSKMPV